MNAARRNRISAVLAQLDAIRSEIESIKEEEESAFENMPYSLQESDKGERMQEQIDVLDTAESDTQTTIDALQEILS